MKLPNGERAQIDVHRKLIGYCLNESHRTGRHKARVFESALGITPENVHLLTEALRAAARDSQAKMREKTVDATKYEIEFKMTGPRGTAVVRSGWVIERGSEIPRLATCYIKARSAGGSHGPRT